LDFPEHGYTDWGYEMYEENCFYTLKTFLPDLEDKQIQELYNTLYDKAYDPDCHVSMKNKPSPKVIYYSGNTGLYPYFRGGMIYICIIPVTQQYLNYSAENSIEIYEIDKM